MKWAVIILSKRPLKGAFLKSFIAYPKAALIPEKKFDAVFAFVDKDIDISGERVFFKLRAGQDKTAR